MNKNKELIADTIFAGLLMLMGLGFGCFLVLFLGAK